ncbi:MAG: ATP-dependent RecD-like DNA helicase, partial [Cyanobacteria bacterium P01_H01_bin.121]
THPKYGEQFQVERYEELKPATLTGIEKYLGSGLIKGVGPITARRIVEHFGLETLTVIESDIGRLIEVPGIAQKRVRLIQAAWDAQQAIKEVMLFLQQHNVSTTYAVKIYKQYGADAIAVVTRNPYQLTQDVYGIGFVTADAIARNLGIAANSEFRYRSGLLHILNEAGDEGHCYLPRVELVQRAIKLLTLADHEPDSGQIDFIIECMVNEQGLVLEAELDGIPCYAPAFFHAERKLAQRLQQHLSLPLVVDLARVERWLERFTTKNQLQLAEHQAQAVKLAAAKRILILTGGPGTGKTFTTRTIVALWQAMGKHVLLASPTGRAAQRLTELTGVEAKTIHRLLEFSPKTMDFQRNEEHPIEADAIVLDEVSMLDLFLANHLFKAIPLDAQVLLVGDADQLPSVGAGNVLHDLIASGQVPVIQLQDVFRQAQTSQIVLNAHRINQGGYPELTPVAQPPSSDCLWLHAPDPEAGVQALQDLLLHFLPSLQLQPTQHVQILCPMVRGVMGTRNLNQVLQATLNPLKPGQPELVRGRTCLRLGDRVIQQVNDYDRDVFNGDLGTVQQLDLEEQDVTVQYGTRLVTYDAADLNEIALAWAITIHKAQGSEFPVVILPFFMQHYIMLSRNLIYTGLTRAKQLAIFLGPKQAINFAVREVKERSRYTTLAHRLKPGNTA